MMLIILLLKIKNILLISNSKLIIKMKFQVKAKVKANLIKLVKNN